MPEKVTAPANVFESTFESVPLRVTASLIMLLFKLTLVPLNALIVPLKVFRLPSVPSVLNVKLSPLPLIVSSLCYTNVSQPNT